MRILVAILLSSAIANVGLAQEPSLVSSEATTKIQIHRLTIDANNLPNGERKQIIRSLEHVNFLQGEVQERIRTAFRDLGYFKASVDEPTFSFLSQTQPVAEADVSIKVDEGIQYHLGDIRFVQNTVFPADRLRPLFQIQTGDLFATTPISKGLDQLRHLYATEGYINCVATPGLQINESNRTINLVFEIDEGKPFDFGRLLLNGTEPHAGAGQALMESWKMLQGKRVNPNLLKSWLTANASEWPGSRDFDRIVTYMQQPDSHVVDIRLQLP